MWLNAHYLHPKMGPHVHLWCPEGRQCISNLPALFIVRASMHGDGLFPLGSGTIQEINVVQRLNPATILFVFEKSSFREARGKDHLSV